MWSKKGGNKYGNKKQELAGRTFDSRAEASLFSLLSLRERAGEISNLAHHPGTVYLSEARIRYQPDFRFTNNETGETEWAEFKGLRTREYAIKENLWRIYGPGPLTVYVGSAARISIRERIIPKGAEHEKIQSE